MDFLHNNSLINQVVQKLFKHKQNDYPQQSLQCLLYYEDIEHELHNVVNPSQQKLYTSLFKRGNNPQICIVYMHGYGSNRLECVNIVRGMPWNYALCCFDFSGSGKSEGETTTYGIKQKQDINIIIQYLKQLQYKKFILWGRSMGATSLLLYSLKYKPRDVVLQIIDSPFYSFETIALQIASKNVRAPQFILSFAIQLAKKNCQNLQYNPFTIELSDVGQCQISTLFVYHQEDNVINSKNTHLICQKYKGTFQKLVIDQNHNTFRSFQTIDQIFSFIEKYYKKYQNENIVVANQNGQLSSRRDYLTSRSNSSKGYSSVDSNGKYKPRKGIERVNIQLSTPQIQDYGMSFINSKLANSPHIKRKYASCKRNNLNQSGYPNSKRQIKLNLMQVSKQTSQMCQPSMKMSTPKKQKRKISTVKSLGVSRFQEQ